MLVGDAASALHAGHRVSLDADHVLIDLNHPFDEVLEALEAMAGWQTRRRKRPVMILGMLDGVETGIRQLMRTRPLETETVLGIRVPALREMLRIKASAVLSVLGTPMRGPAQPHQWRLAPRSLEWPRDA